jgi:hypothetical protein
MNFKGAHVLLLALCVFELANAKALRSHRKHNILMLVFASVMFALCTINWVTTIVGNVHLFVDNIFPGGPSGDAASAYFYSLPISKIAVAVFFLGSSLSDILLVRAVVPLFLRNLTAISVISRVDGLD